MISRNRLYQINSSRILQFIRQNPGLSRIATAEELGLDRSTLTKAVREFMEDGLVRETGKYRGKPGAGRMATGLEIVPDYGLVLGIEIQTERFRWVLADLEGKILYSGSGETEENPEKIPETVIELYRALAARSAAGPERIIGIGIGLSGIIDPYSGTIRQSYPLGVMHPLPISEKIAEGTGVPVFLENDANCCCWGQQAFSQGQRVRNFLALLGEFRNIDLQENRRTGFAFGVGIVIRDTVLHGDNFTAGEFRSLLYDQNKPSHSQFSLTDDEAARLPADADVLHRLFDEAAYNIALLVNILDITKIVIAGDFARYPDELRTSLASAISKNSLYHDRKLCDIEFSLQNELAVSHGAAGLFVEKLFSVPGMTDHTDEEVGSILLDRIAHREESRDQ